MASASCTPSNTVSYADFINRVDHPKVPFERVPKEPGSKKLVHGEWVRVKAEDEDAIFIASGTTGESNRG